MEKTDEGKVFWVDTNDLQKLDFSKGFKERFPMFLEKEYSEGFGIWNEHSPSKIKWL